jgi:hypothetical protein
VNDDPHVFQVIVSHRGTARLIYSTRIDQKTLAAAGEQKLRDGVAKDMGAAVAEFIVNWAARGFEIKVSPVE